MNLLDSIGDFWFREDGDEALREKVEVLRSKAPPPVFWLFGKTQSGKTSIIRYLTGAEDAEIGSGFRPTTRFSRRYDFPTADTPLLAFLDTRGLDEPSYDPQEDIEQFRNQAHAVLVTVRATDFALENVVKHLRRIRAANPQLPVVLVVTCLHEAYPHQQHPLPYPFEQGWDVAPPAAPEPLVRCLADYRQRFEGLADRFVAVDLTKPEEGFNDPDYGGEHLTKVLLEVLPEAYRQTLLRFEEASKELRDWYERRAHPYIVAYSVLAGTVALLPVPFLGLPAIIAVQLLMARKLAQLYGMQWDNKRFRELVVSVIVVVVIRQLIREFAKVIPYIGSLVAAGFAAASTYALGRALCYYYSAVLKGHVPKPEDIRRYYKEQLKQAEAYWKERFKKNPPASASENSTS